MNPRLLMLFSVKKNLLPNSVWAGGGSVPTFWTGASTGTSAPYALASDGASMAYRDTATAQRPSFEFTTGISVGSNVSMTFSAYIDTIFSGTFTIIDVISWAALPSGASLTYRKNGASVASSSPLLSGDRIECVITTASTAGTARPRIGIGVNVNFTGDLVMSRPMVNVGPTAAPYRATY
jgi:hypothetical protein